VPAGVLRCHLHADPFADLFTPEEQAVLAGLVGERRAAEVLPALIVAIRRALAGGASPGVVVRACEAYVRALREAARTAPPAVDPLALALAALSDELGSE
jgi:hypothetical protein